MAKQRYVQMGMIIPIIMIAIGLVLLFDELWMFGSDIGHILPDLSVIHVEPFHHYMWGIALILSGSVFLVMSQMGYVRKRRRI